MRSVFLFFCYNRLKIYFFSKIVLFQKNVKFVFFIDHPGLVWALPDPSGRGEHEHQSIVVIRGAQALTVGVRLAAS